MALDQTKAVNLPDAFRSALIAAFTGAPFAGPVAEPKVALDITAMHYSRSVQVSVSEQDAPGIEEWLRSFRPGFRNCAIKCILRHYLGFSGAAFLFADGVNAIAGETPRPPVAVRKDPAAPAEGRVPEQKEMTARPGTEPEAGREAGQEDTAKTGPEEAARPEGVQMQVAQPQAETPQTETPRDDSRQTDEDDEWLSDFNMILDMPPSNHG